MANEGARDALIDGLLDALTDVLDVREAFDRVSQLAQPILSHDMMGIVQPGEHGLTLRLLASAGPDAIREPFEIRLLEPGLLTTPWEFYILDDLQRHPLYNDAPAAKAGMQSGLVIPIRFGGRLHAAVNFFSREPARFTEADVPIAKRIAKHIALAMSHDHLAAEARRAAELQERAANLERRVRVLTEELDARSGYRRVIGESPAWKQILTQAARVAATETTVLLVGETGTGKEVVARLLHRGSPRRDGPFVALNCAALPEHLLEAELFGFERGAFTGATQSKPGQIEQAAGGVLFLDEVGEMTPPAQAKLLRMLQEREFQRLGGTRVLRADVRVVAATNRDLGKAIERGTFREDLYYRLNVFELTLPPLRARRDDILLLSEAFLHDIGRSLGRPPSGISHDARRALTDYAWPGNVRELRNVLERAAILSDGGLIAAEHLSLRPTPRVTPADLAVGASAAAAGSLDLPSVERTMIEKALQAARFNKSQAAKALGL